MEIPASVKPAVWGAVGGAIAAMVVGFAWGGWVTERTAGQMSAANAQSAVVLAFTPLCVAKAEQQPDKFELLKKENTWSRSAFVVKQGWVAGVSEKYQSQVAGACATTIVEGMDAAALKAKR